MNLRTALPLLLASFITLAASKPASAQLFEEDWELRIGVGALSTNNLVWSFIDRSCEWGSWQSVIPFVAPSVEISYMVNSWLSVGAEATMSFHKERLIDHEGKVIGSEAHYNTQVLIGARARYFWLGAFSMYGSVSAPVIPHLGLSIHTQSGHHHEYRYDIPEINFYPLCFSWGGWDGFFAEIGIGNKGLLNVGYFKVF